MHHPFESLESRTLFHAEFSAAVNFAPLDAPRAPGMLTDYGVTYGVRRGGLSYGWSSDVTANAVDRNVTRVQRNDTFIRTGDATWEIAVPEAGNYTVYVVAGDPAHNGDRIALEVEGAVAVAGLTKPRKPFLEGAVTVAVSDGKLSIRGAGEFGQDLINYVSVVSSHSETKSIGISATVPSASEQGQVAGRLLIQRTGDLTESITVPLSVSGSAANSVDYGRVGSKVVLGAGVSQIELPIVPVVDGISEGPESMTVTLGAVSGYIFSQASASVSIADTPAPLGTLAWTTTTSMPVGTSEAFGGIVNDKFYIFGGYVDNTFKPTTAARVFNPSNGSWSSIASYPIGVSHAATANDDRYFYFAGGYPATATAQSFATANAYRYDTVTNSYTTLPSLPQARGAGAGALIGRTFLFMGGADASRKDRTEVWALNLDNLAAGWVAKQALPEARNHPAAVELGGSVYFIGGQQFQDTASVYKTSVWRYDMSSNAWTTLASLPSARSHITDSTFVRDGRIITIGGEGVAQAKLRVVNAYNPATNSWSTLTSLPSPRFSAVADVLSDGRILLTSGFNSTFEKATFVGTFS
jgi:N-acetylneuraminic acid mutarotase